MEDISRSGILLRNIEIEEDFAPTKPFYFKIQIPEKNLNDLMFKCQPMRFGILEQGIEIGLKFSGSQDKALKELLDAFQIDLTEEDEEY